MLNPFKLLRDETNINFMKVHKLFMAVSVLLMIASIVMLFTRGINLGIDFTGGLLMEVQTPADVGIADVRQALSGLSTGTPTIQEFGGQAIMIKIPGKEADQATQKALYAEVKKALGEETEFRRVEYVGPQVGHELIMVGVKAFVYSLLATMLYIWVRFEWQFGVTGVLSLAHDVCLTMLFLIITGFEFDLSTIAAVLLVASYSINDTIVVFDRIREMLRKYRKKALPELLNLSVNQTLSRTLVTSFSTMLALVPLLIFGAESIKGFTYVMLVGILVGTYSSIFVAAPVLMYLNLRNNDKS